MGTRGARILAMGFSNNSDKGSTQEFTGNTSGAPSELNIIEQTDYFPDSGSGQNATNTSAQNLNNIEEDDEPDERFQDSGSSYKPTDSEGSDSGKNNILQPRERKNRGFALVTENRKTKRARKGHSEPNMEKKYKSDFKNEGAKLFSREKNERYCQDNSSTKKIGSKTAML
ncbi:hypothetical protein CBL_11623 [Carabus blaptoides fortunei]